MTRVLSAALLPIKPRADIGGRTRNQTAYGPKARLVYSEVETIPHYAHGGEWQTRTAVSRRYVRLANGSDGPLSILTEVLAES